MIYIISNCGWIVTATTDKSVADRIVEKFSNTDYPVDVKKVDDSVFPEQLLRNLYLVSYDANNAPSKVIDVSQNILAYTGFAECLTRDYNGMKYYCFANSEADAVKRAQERIDEYFAKQVNET